MCAGGPAGTVDAMPSSTMHPLFSRDDRPVTFAEHAGTRLLHHGERILAEVPAVLRRVRMVLLVLAVTIPAFLFGLLIVLWRLT
jgi:hypothetical protein